MEINPRIFAERAAELEREKKLEEAAKAWKTAKDKATTSAQREWCENRKEFCKRWQGRIYATDEVNEIDEI